MLRKNSRVMNVLLEVNIGEEESKSGVSAKQLLELAEQAAELKNISIKGLMAIPPRGADESVFAHMHELFLTLKEKKFTARQHGNTFHGNVGRLRAGHKAWLKSGKNRNWAFRSQKL